ncbi:MAG: LysR family transcriptional regulator [Acidobacteriota bacterium]
MDLQRLRSLNYQHLLYFFVVAREGSLVAASRALNVTQPTLSAQIGKLEKHLGEPLFRRVGRGLELTPYGELALDWASRFFHATDELLEGLEQGSEPEGRRYTVGIVDSFPKLLSYRILAPLLEGDQRIVLECHENKQSDLLAELALNRIDLVLSSRGVSPGERVRAYNHLLGESPVGVFGRPGLARELEGNFPDSLEGARWILPTRGTSMRSRLEEWFDRRKAHPQIVGEMDDAALVKAFASFGAGVFAAPLVESEEVCRQYGVEFLGPLDTRPERFYLITGARRLHDPLTSSLAEQARHLFRPYEPA